jgi:hypothetical protein
VICPHGLVPPRKRKAVSAGLKEEALDELSPSPVAWAHHPSSGGHSWESRLRVSCQAPPVGP